MAQLLKQRYVIISKLGQGGMGAVYKAEDTHLGNRPVAIKEMIQRGLSPQEIIAASSAFKQEAYMLARLHHPNLPTIHEHFEEAGCWYLVMSFIEGETLADYLQAKGGKLPIKEVLDIGIQLCTVLDYLHNRQPPIIFRDLKPQNSMRVFGGHLYLIDFGIARHFTIGKTSDTRIGLTPGYASPEQYGLAQTTPRSDIYSLGATLHQLLSGSNPSHTPFRFAPLQLQGQPNASRLEALILRMVEMDETKRPASMAAVKQELQGIANQEASEQRGTRLSGASQQTALPFQPAPVVVQSPPYSQRLAPKNYDKPKQQVLSPTPYKSRPLGITIITIIIAISGILSIIGGIALLSASATAAIVAIVLGVLQLILAWGLWTLQRWAFWATVVIEVLAVINGILALLVQHQVLSGIIGIIIAPIILIYLFAGRNVRAAFGT